MKKVLYIVFLFISACSSSLKTIVTVREPQKIDNLERKAFNYPRSQQETINKITYKLSNSPFLLENPKDNFSFLTIRYSGQPDLFIDCGKTIIADKDGNDTINKTTINNTKSTYTYKKYRHNHLDTYSIQNKLAMKANLIITGDDYSSTLLVQPVFYLTVKKEISSTQGIMARKIQKFRLQLISGDQQSFEAFGTRCNSTGKFENMIVESLS